MRTCVIFLACTLFACAGTDTRRTTSHPDENPIAAFPDPVSAPSAKIGHKGGESQASGQGANGPVLVNFTDVKFSIVLPSGDWKLQNNSEAVIAVNEKLISVVVIGVSDDARPLKEIAETERKGLLQSGKFVVSEVVMLADPERAVLTMSTAAPDGTKLMLSGFFMRNPGNPKQTLSFITTWTDGHDKARDEAFGIVASVKPLP